MAFVLPTMDAANTLETVLGKGGKRKKGWQKEKEGTRPILSSLHQTLGFFTTGFIRSSGMRLGLWLSARTVCGLQRGGGRWMSGAGLGGAHFAASEGAMQVHAGGAMVRDLSILRLVVGMDAWRKVASSRHMMPGLEHGCELQQVRCLGSFHKPSSAEQKPSGKKVGAPRGPLWRTRKAVSKEVVQAVQDLKRAKTESDVSQVFKSRVSRLLKIDLIGVLHEMQRQDECELALKVFDHMRKEPWYKADIFLYRDLLGCLSRNKEIEKVEQVWSILESEMEPELIVWTELIGAYLRSNLNGKAVETFERMRASGIDADHFTYSILIKALWKADDRENASRYRDERMRAFPGMEASLKA